MPAFRCADTIVDALQSVLGQDYHNLVVGVGVPPSDHETVAAIRAIGDDRIVVVEQLGKGISDGRNRVIETIDADLYMFLDADDRMFPGVVSAYVDARAQSDEPGLRYGHYSQEPPEGIGQKIFRQAPFLGKVSSAFPKLCLLNFVATGTVMIDREVVETVGLFSTEYRHGEDWHYWSKIARAYPVFGLDVVAYSYSYGKLTGAPHPRSFFDDAKAAIRELAPPPLVLMMSLCGIRAMYALYYLRTLRNRKTLAQLRDISLWDIASLPAAAVMLALRRIAMV